MWCWRRGVAFAAVASVIAGVSVCPPSGAWAQSYRINNVDRAARIHMRETPSNQSKVVAYLPTDSRLEGTGNCDSKWCEVTFKGARGWVFRKYLIDDPKGAAKAVAATPREEPAVGSLPKPAEPGPDLPAQDSAAKDLGPREIPSDLHDPMLRLVFPNGRDIPVYAFPSDRLPAAGRIAYGTQEVEDLSTCTRKFCYIRSGLLVGWISDEAIAKEDKPGGDPPHAIDNTVPTATQGPAILDGLGSIEVKTYTLAGLSGDASLPVREAPQEDARILGWVAGDVKSVEGMRKCVTRWCLIRHEELTGWVARRHLADENSAGQRFQVSGVALWGALDVVDYPGADASIVGHIPSYATGIVPIGGCDKDWCHVRYLGIAGWVAAKYIEPQRR